MKPTSKEVINELCKILDATPKEIKGFMTPKEKARELVDNFKNGLWKDRVVSIYSEDAIYCALIAVNEILEVILFNKYDDKYWEEEEYWKEVKQEIEKL